MTEQHAQYTPVIFWTDDEQGTIDHMNLDTLCVLMERELVSNEYLEQPLTLEEV